MVLDPEKQLGGQPSDVNELFFDALLRHQIGLLRVSGSVRNEILTLLDATEEDLRRQIARGLRSGAGLSSPAKVDKLNKLLRDLDEIRGAAWNQVSTVWRERLTELALAEPGIVDNLLKTVIPVTLETRLPTATTLRGIVTAQPFEGRTMREWAKKVAVDDLARIETQVKIGLTQSETTPQIARRIVGRVSLRGTDGVTEISRRDAQTITRTLVNGIGNHTRREFFVDNADVFSEEQYVATLDSRTTLICASLDGTLFPVGEGEIPPLHMNCRSIRVAVIDGAPIARRPAKPFTERQLLREFSAGEEIRPVTKRDALPFGFKGKFDAFKRLRVRELTGSATDKIGYEAWLKKQSNQFQDDYLGQTKAKLFRGGKPLKGFVDPAGRPISLSELSRLDAKAFEAAGLDPEAFR